MGIDPNSPAYLFAQIKTMMEHYNKSLTNIEGVLNRLPCVPNSDRLKQLEEWQIESKEAVTIRNKQGFDKHLVVFGALISLATGVIMLVIDKLLP